MATYEAGIWPIDYSLVDNSVFEGKTLEAKAAMEKMAINQLWDLTKRQFSLYEVTIRPRAPREFQPPSTFCGAGPIVPYPLNATWLPLQIGGQWFNFRCGTCAGNCNCDPLQKRSIKLPNVNEVTAIVINGETLVLGEDYWVDGDIVRLLGDWTFPFQQDNRLPLGTAGAITWAITYKRGVPVPIGGQLAAGMLSVELAKASLDDRGTLFPKRVATSTRNGSTTATVDLYEQLDKGRTGLTFVDNWLNSVNQERHAASVRSVDTAPMRATS